MIDMPPKGDEKYRDDMKKTLVSQETATALRVNSFPIVGGRDNKPCDHEMDEERAGLGVGVVARKMRGMYRRIHISPCLLSITRHL